MALKERSQNPVVGDELTLRLFTYNSNQRQNVAAVEKVDIFFLDPECADENNTLGLRLVESIDGALVSEIADGFGGQYSITINLADQQYVIGKYLDVWHLEFESGQEPGTVENKFQVVPDLWYTSVEPIVYGFSFQFRPNRLRSGERRWLIVDVMPNVPNATDLERYYANLAVASPLRISIEQACGDCVPQEQDLRLVVDRELVELRKGCEGHYFLDTAALELDCGIYNVWFEMEFGESLYISEHQQLQIF